MRLIRLLFILFGSLAITLPAMATDFYYAATAQGSNNGTSCANAYAYNDGTNGVNASAKNAAGNVLHVCGTITLGAGATFWAPPNSGTSGNPITLKFENGAGIQAPYFGDDPFAVTGAAIFCNGKNYITVDGGATPTTTGFGPASLNGVIQNTANGSASLGYANQHASTGIEFYGCNHFVVQNGVNVKNIFVHAEGDTISNTVNSSDIFSDNGSDQFTITGSSFTYARLPANFGYETGVNITGCTISFNTFDQGIHILTIGDGSAATASGCSIHNNIIGPHNQAWSTDGSDHQDGLFLQSSNAGSVIQNFNIYNNQIPTDMCSNRADTGNNCTAPVFWSGTVKTTNFFNNSIYYVTSTGGLEGLLKWDNGNGTASGNQIYNNVWDMNNADSGQSCDCAMIKLLNTNGGSETTAKLQNNIFINNQHTGIDNNDATSAIPTKFTTINNNLWYNVAKIGHDDTNSQDYITLANWQASHATNSFPGYDGAGSGGNPNLTAQPDYAPQSGSAAISLGANLTSLSITPLDSDAIGVARPSTGAWDTGWKQFASTPPPTWNPGITISQLAPPTNLRIVSIDGVALAQAAPAKTAKRTLAQAFLRAVGLSQ